MTHHFSSGSPYESQIGFSRAVRVGPRILISGTAPIGPNGVSHGIGDVAAQTERCLEIIVEAIEALGGRRGDVVRTRIFLTNASDWEKVGRVHGEFFGMVRPACTCVVVSALLRPEWCIEIEAEAIIPKHVRIDLCKVHDRAWIENRCEQFFGGSTVVSWGVANEPALLPAFIARQEGERVGFVCYHIEDHACEVVAMEACPSGRGIGTALLHSLEEAAQRAGCKRFWLVTTNDNLDALRFYQRRGLFLVDVRPRAVEKSRAVRPTIPLVGGYKIPVRDELLLEKVL